MIKDISAVDISDANNFYISHDRVTRFSRNNDFNKDDFYNENKKSILQIASHEDNDLIADDFIVEKDYISSCISLILYNIFNVTIQNNNNLLF